MKLLTAAAGGVPGELVLTPPVCDTPNCGCENDFIGMSSGQLVTVAVVADVDMSAADLTDVVRAHLIGQGWNDEELVADVVEGIREDADGHPVGWRVRRSDDEVVPE